MSDGEKIIKDFLTEMATQDNRLTAFPYYYVIRSAKWIAAYHVGEGERDVYRNDDDFEDEFVVNSNESLVDVFRKQYAEEGSLRDGLKVEEMLDYDIELYVCENYTQYSECKDWRECGMFLTEKDAQAHLEANHYHYSKDAHTYVKHCWRASKLYTFFRALFKHFGVEKGNLDIGETRYVERVGK